MRKLYDSFFRVSEHGKIREKVILTRLIVSVAIVITCLASMGVTAFAYFTCNISTNTNIIKAAKFETKVTIKQGNENGADTPVTTSDYKSHWANLDADTTYYVTLQHTEHSQVGTGFMIVEATDCGVKYHTQQIGKDANGDSETVAFYLKPTADTKVTFQTHWGTSSHFADFEQANAEEYIENGETVGMTITGIGGLNAITQEDDANIPTSTTKKEPQKDESKKDEPEKASKPATQETESKDKTESEPEVVIKKESDTSKSKETASKKETAKTETVDLTSGKGTDSKAESSGATESVTEETDAK